MTLYHGDCLAILPQLMTGEYVRKLEIRNRADLQRAMRGMKDGEVLIRIERLIPDPIDQERRSA